MILMVKVLTPNLLKTNLLKKRNRGNKKNSRNKERKKRNWRSFINLR